MAGVVLGAPTFKQLRKRRVVGYHVLHVATAAWCDVASRRRFPLDGL
jgi:hypothetical protein